MTPLEYDRRHIWHPYASIGNPPPVNFAKSASGVEIELADGSRLVDAVSSWWCVAHGHNHPAIVEAMRRQSERLCHVMFGGFTHEPAVELAERLAAFAPPGLDRVFFADSGSISVEVAAKMAVQYQNALGHPERNKLVALKGGYHGDTSLCMALSDPDGMPVFQAANAMNFYHPEYLREMRRVCDERGILLIFDEIAAGLHRTGPRWAHERSCIAPDIMTVGKALTGGHITLAAALASRKVADTISAGTPGAFMHGPTYMANPLACAAACASLDLFVASDYEAKAREIGRLFAEGLSPLRSLPNVRGVRVMGAVGIVEVGRLPAAEDISRVIRKHGVWLRPFCNFIYSMPPLVSDADVVGRIVAAISDLASAPPGPPPADGAFHE